MSGPETPDAPPPEMPEEYLAAYNEAYRRALEAEDVVHADPATGRHRSRDDAAPADLPGEEIAPEPARAVGDHDRPGWLVPALLAGLALLLVLGAYGIGKLVGDDEPEAPAPSASPAPQKTPQKSPSSDDGSGAASSDDAWDGKVTEVNATGAKASCTARPGVDSAGKPVRYRASNTLDGDPATAWRCDGTAEGEKLRFELPDDTEIAEVGLIPGYAKTDPASGTDRYAENNRITRVRWTFGDGVSVEQSFDPDPKKRGLQTLRVEPVETDEVTLEILEVARGPRNTTAISEAAFGAAER